MKRSRELRGLMLAIYADWAADDRSFLDILSDDADMLLIGTDPAEWFRGGPAVREIFRRQLGEFRVRPDPGQLHAFSEGDIGWVIDDPVLHVIDGPSVPIRSTVVFRREDGAWRIVHWHVSVGAANEETLGVELTTSLDALAEQAAREHPDVGPQASPNGEVTIVFTDIESSTALNERLGDAIWLEVLRAHDVLVRKALADEGGTLVKNQGDGYMLAFPQPHGAARFSISLQRALADQPAEPVKVRVRIGMHSGTPVRQADDFFGRDVAFAARVAAAAAGGEVLASARVREAIAEGIALGEARSCTLKGFDGFHDLFPVVVMPS